MGRVIDAWAQGGLEDVTLPSGLRVRGKLPLTQDLILAGIADATLIGAIVALGDKAIGEFDEAERVTWIRWQRVQAAAFVREAYDPKSHRWEPATVTPEMLANGVPPQDVDALEDIVLRRRTPAQVTAQARFMAGQIDGDELKRLVAEEASGTIAAWSSFRQLPPGADRGADSGGVRQSAEPAAREPRAVRRARSRSGAGAATHPGTPAG